MSPSTAAMIEVLVSDGLLDWVDTAGRLLGEQASKAYATAESDSRRCPFPGGRRDETMNGAALRQVNRRWKAVLQVLRDQSGPTASHAWQATCRLRWAPLFSPRPVSEPSAAAFKTALGLNRPLTSWLLLTPGAASAPLHALASPEQLIRRLESEHWLLGSQQVCAGSPEQIREAWQHLAGPSLPGPHPAADTARVVSGLWAVLGRTRALLLAGDLSEVPGWSPVAKPDPRWPKVAQWLLANGPGALVREVPRFDPRWSFHLWDDVPESLTVLVNACERAESLRALDGAWVAFMEEG